MPRQIFKGRVIATAGPPPPGITLENLRNWIPLRKGRFAEPFDEEVTHLLCTHEEFKKRAPLVKQVLKNHKRIHIVHYDWLEFSAVANKRQPERDYSMRNILAKERAKERERVRQENGRLAGQRSVNPTLFHVYQDREFFSYQIDITRNDTDDAEFRERHTLTLWESNAKPHLYWFTVKHMRRKGDRDPSYWRPSLYSGKWRKEMDHFMTFFHKKTNIDWRDRVLLEGTTPPSVFQYSPPTGGKPVGRRLRFSYDCCIELNLELKQQNRPQGMAPEGEHEGMEEAAGAVEDTAKEDGENDDCDVEMESGEDDFDHESPNSQLFDCNDPTDTEPRCPDGSADANEQTGTSLQKDEPEA